MVFHPDKTYYIIIDSKFSNKKVKKIKGTELLIMIQDGEKYKYANYIELATYFLSSASSFWINNLTLSQKISIIGIAIGSILTIIKLF